MAKKSGKRASARGNETGVSKRRAKFPDKQGINREFEVGYKKPPITAQWKPGQSGNLNGRPKSHDELRDLIREIAALAHPDERAQGMTRLQMMILGMLASRHPADHSAILEHGWGKVTQPVALNFDAELVNKAKELGIDWKSDPILSEIFTAAGIAPDCPATDGTAKSAAPGTGAATEPPPAV